jgi:hypothetical protein
MAELTLISKNAFLQRLPFRGVSKQKCRRTLTSFFCQLVTFFLSCSFMNGAQEEEEEEDSYCPRAERERGVQFIRDQQSDVRSVA